jgi:hypothetical protein
MTGVGPARKRVVRHQKSCMAGAVDAGQWERVCGGCRKWGRGNLGGCAFGQLQASGADVDWAKVPNEWSQKERGEAATWAMASMRVNG